MLVVSSKAYLEQKHSSRKETYAPKARSPTHDNLLSAIMPGLHATLIVVMTTFTVLYFVVLPATSRK